MSQDMIAVAKLMVVFSSVAGAVAFATRGFECTGVLFFAATVAFATDWVIREVTR